MPTLKTLLAAAALAVAIANQADAKELRVLSTIGIQAALEEIAPAFEAASGHKLSISFATAAIIAKRVQAGETADLLILTRESLAELGRDGKAASEPNGAIASSGIGVSVKRGAPKPDISTPEAFKQTLLAARSIAYSDPAFGGASGVYLAGLLQRMGIADQIRPKTKHPPASGNAAQLLVTGEADLAIQQKPEVMSVAGAELIGLLPGDTNNVTIYAAGLPPGSSDPETARALITFLHTPKATEIFRSRGLDPP